MVSKLHRIQVKGVDDSDSFLAEQKVEPVGSGLQFSNLWRASTHKLCVTRTSVCFLLSLF